MQQFKRSPLQLSWHHLAIIALFLMVIVCIGAFISVFLGGTLHQAIVEALGLVLWSLLVTLVLGVGAYGALLLAGRVHSLRRFAPASSRAEEGWHAILLAALAAIWLLVVRVWMLPGPHSDLWVALWLLSSVALGFTSSRRALVRALIRCFGPREAGK